MGVNGFQEDQYYAMAPYLVQNIRRGNTILEITDENGNTNLCIGRKGLMKFFDMRLDFVSKEDRVEVKKSKNPETHMTKNYILAPVLRAIKQGLRVEVFKTLKANGENVQVSYSKEAKAWVICSKNVAILCNTIEQAEAYKTMPMSDRYSFAIEMAQAWFKKLE